MPTLVKVRKWGNSLGLRLPKSFAAEREIVDGTMLRIDDLQITGFANRRRSRHRLADLLKNYKAPPRDFDFMPVGKEFS